VADHRAQCETIGDLHHAIAAGAMRASDIRGELGDVVAGTVRGRLNDDEIIIFDSTGVALQDVAAAAVVYERAVRAGIGQVVRFGS
jgi:ornithine cyclodeaminase/alanine dehydrogenase-like protein (mu-crystallin family)